MDSLPLELRQDIFVRYRVGLRHRMAQRRLSRVRKRTMVKELAALFQWTHRDFRVLLYLLRRPV